MFRWIFVETLTKQTHNIDNGCEKTPAVKKASDHSDVDMFDMSTDEVIEITRLIIK